jgi:hypothetical protein
MRIMLVPVVALVACASSSDPPPTTTSAHVSSVTRDRALDAITDARCAREFSCAHVGAGQTWRDYDTCARNVRLTMRDTLFGATCDDGVEAARLSSCVSDIRDLHCDAPEDTIVRFGTCANAKLCKR